MKALLREWDRTGKNVTAITEYLLAFVLTVFMDVTGLFRYLRGHGEAAVFYLVFASASLALLYGVSRRIRKGEATKPTKLVYPVLAAFFIFGLTALFFIDGGMQGGAYLFFVLGFVATPCFLPVKEALFMLALEFAAYACNIGVALYFPEAVRGEGYAFSDLLLPLLLVGTALGAMCLLYMFAYRRQTDHLSVALEEAERADLAQNIFLDNMSQEFRTPINTILGMNELVLREAARPEVVEYADQIRRSSQTLLSVINDILDYSRIRENKVTINPIRYNLSSLINDMVHIAAEEAGQKGLDFHVYTDRDIPRILIGDEYHIRQVVLNILNNAVKYTDHGTVTFRADYDKVDEETILLRVSVEDTGVGIREEDMEHIFKPFEQAGTTGAGRAQGTGLGLSIVQSLLDLMGSRLEIRSVPGEGSTFSFALKQQVQKWEPLGDYSAAYRASARAFHGRRPQGRQERIPETPVHDVTADKQQAAGVLSAPAKDPDAVYRSLSGIDYDAACKNCGSAAVFKEALSVFYETIKENADRIEGFAENKDYRNYTVLVHALKSSARLIGALQLSAHALHLEEAGNAKDEAEIAEKTPALLRELRAFHDILHPLFRKEEENLPELSATELEELYGEIRRLANDFDLDGLDGMIKQAGAYRMPEGEKEVFERVKKAVRDADWGALEEALSLTGAGMEV